MLDVFSLENLRIITSLGPFIVNNNLTNLLQILLAPSQSIDSLNHILINNQIRVGQISHSLPHVIKILISSVYRIVTINYSV